MKFEWDRHEYPDGSQASRHYVKVLADNGKELDHGWVDDHTTPRAKADDLDCRREVYYAYSIHLLDLHDSVLTQVFRDHGFKDEDFGCSGYNQMGICPNDWEEHPCEYVGTPSCSIEDVLDMVEEAACLDLRKRYENYKANLLKMQDGLQERKDLMEEADKYLADKENVKQAEAEEEREER